MAQSSLRGVGTFHLLKFELIRPGDDGPPDQLIEEDDDRDHGGETPENRASVAAAGGSLQKRTKAGETEIALAEDEHLASHQEKPAAGDGHHGIPDQADGGEGQVEFGETLPAAEAEDFCGFVEFARNGFQRGIKTEGDVPDLSGEDEKNRAQLDAELAARKERDHGKHDAGKKAEHGNGLQDVQQRNQDDFSAARSGRDVAIGERESKTECVSDADAHQGIESVKREDAGILRNLSPGRNGTEPGAADGINTKNRGEDKQKNSDVDKERPAPARSRGPLHGGRERGGLGRGKSGGRHGTVRPR